MNLHASACDELRGWTPSSDPQRDLRESFLAYLADHRDGVWRTSAQAHLTASALVLDTDARKLLLVLHPKVGRWLQPGGHCEASDSGLAAAALREATEESGIAGLELVRGILHLDRHPAPCNRGVVEEHLDVRYLVLAPAESRAVASVESLDARWFEWDALPEDLEATIIEMLVVARRRLGLGS